MLSYCSYEKPYTYYIYYAEEGGIQALLRLGRVRSTDEQLQYKTSLTIGQLATNAVKLIPSRPSGTMPTEEMLNTSEIGAGTKMLTKIRAQSDVQRGRELTLGYLTTSTKEGEGEDDHVALSGSKGL